MIAEQCCKEETQLLENELKKLTIKCKNLNEEYMQSLVENLKKDIEIKALKEKVGTKPFSSLEGKISKIALDELRLVGHTKTDDTRFVSIAMNDLHDGNADLIKKLTLSGKLKGGGEAKMLSPEKRAIIEDLYQERLQILPQNEVDEGRKKNLSKLMRNVIDNMNRTKKTE